MRATSFRRTAEPSVLARSTMLPNCSTLLSWPVTTTVAAMLWPVMLGRSPMEPEETCAFCPRMAVVTSEGDRFRPCSLAGSIHTRMALSVPKSCAWPMPGTRCSSGTMLREA
jgi:hypothetical protein